MACLKSYNREPECLDTTILTSIIQLVGPKNILQIIFNLDWYPNVTGMLTYKKMLSQEYPWICVAYCAAQVIEWLMDKLVYCAAQAILIVELVVSLIYKYDIEVSLRRLETLRRGEHNTRNSYYLLKALLVVEDELKSLQTSIALLSSDSMKLLEDEQKEEYLTRAKFIDYMHHSFKRILESNKSDRTNFATTFSNSVSC